MTTRKSPNRPLLGVAALTGNVYVYMRNGTKRPVPEEELVTVIVHWLDRHDLVVKKDGYRVRYGVEEILPLEAGESEAPESATPDEPPTATVGPVAGDSSPSS